MEKIPAQSNPISSVSEKGFINIGCHPSNDVVLSGDQILSFHMLIDCRQEPYRLIPLSPNAEIYLNSIRVSSQESFQIRDTDTINAGNHRLRVLPASNGTPARVVVASAQNEAEGELSAFSPAAPMPAGTAGVDASKKEARDDVIIASLDRDSWDIMVEQTASYAVTLVNGSPIVSTFHVAVEGVPEEWVMISPANVNLNEGARAVVNISITPPRRPTSTAGAHPLRFIVTSHNHPDRRVILNAGFNLAPFYDYAIADVKPQRQNIAWHQPSGKVTLDVVNRGNSSAPFLLTAQDEENGCRFQFLDEQGLKQPGSVQHAITPGETRSIGLHISPLKRNLIRLRSQSYNYRVVVNQPQNETLTLFTMGTAIVHPLINALGLILLLLMIAGTIGYLFTPRINQFTVDNNLIGVGESTTLRWDVPFFTHDIKISGIDKAVSGSQGLQVIYPVSTVNTYTFTATTWLWSMLGLPPKSQTATVMALPSEPEITTFTLSTEKALKGDEVTLRWSVDYADKMLLTINGVTETFEDPKEFNGERKLMIEKATMISIVAQNAIGSTVRSKYIEADSPSIVIDRFELSKSSVYTGDQVTIFWKVSGVGMDNGGDVTISAFNSVLPLEGQMTFFPKESMEFVLTAHNRKLQESRILPVGVLEPGTPPEPPTIDFFTAAPDTLTGSGKVELAWSVSGSYDEINITNSDKAILEDIAAQGFRTISVSESGTYVLAATYQGKTAGSNLKITVDPSLIKPKLSIATVYPDSDLEIGDSTAVSISITNPATSDPPVTGQVIITDGTSSCQIDLPKTSCALLFETPGTKTLKAIYYGDSTHVQTESDPYSKTLTVLGNSISLVANVTPSSTLYYYNQSVAIYVSVEGTNTSRIPDGEIRLRRVCDSTATYSSPCTNKVIGYRKLLSEDTGAYKFTNLPVDQLGKVWTLEITFTGDSFYSTAKTTASLTVDPNKHEVDLTATTAAVTNPALINADLPYTITVKDKGMAGIYSAPAGTVTMQADLDNSNSNTILCKDVLLTDAGDGKSATATCTLNLPKTGNWSWSVNFTPAAEDIIHNTPSTLTGDIKANANVNIKIPTTPTALTYGVQQTLDLKLNSNDADKTAITDGSLTCAFPKGASDGTCNCGYNTTASLWKCDINPTPSESLPVDKEITFSYDSSSSGSTELYLNNSTAKQTYQIAKAGTTAIITSSSSNKLAVGDKYSLTVTASHSGGGIAPSTGTVTVVLGTGPCDPTAGMTENTIETYTITLGVASTKTLESKHIGDVRFCVRYEGGDNYSASPWTSSSTINVSLAGTMAVYATTPAGPYDLSKTFTLKVNATLSSGGANLTTGTFTARLGSGTCNPTSGMADYITEYTGSIGSEQTVTFTSSHITGKDIYFCARYNGDGTTYDRSTYVQSAAFRVKAQPTVSLANNPSVVGVVQSLSATGETFVVNVNGGYNVSGSYLQIQDESGNVICPSSSGADPTCSVLSSAATGSGVAFTIQIATLSALDRNVRAVYLGDSNNLTDDSSFVLRSAYNIVLGSVTNSIGSDDLMCYSDLEGATSDVMTTDVTGSLSFEHFSGYSDYASHGLTVSVVGVTASNSEVDVAHGSCALAGDGSITCSDVGVTDSTVSGFRVIVTPTDTSHYLGELEADSEAVDVIQNIIESPTDVIYEIAIGNGGCTSSKQQVFIVSGYAAGTGDPTQTLVPSDFFLRLSCEKDGDGNSSWDSSYLYYTGNSMFSSNLGWTGNQFSFQITPNTSYSGYMGCPSNSDDFAFEVSLGYYRVTTTIPYLAFVSPRVPVHDFESFKWESGRLADNDGTVNYDYCHEYTP